MTVDLYPIDRFHVEHTKEAVAAGVRILEQELDGQGRRKQEQERLSRDLIDVGLALRRKRLQRLDKRAKRFPPMPGTRPAPIFFTEETERSGHQ
jgi:hypothetical protein